MRQALTPVVLLLALVLAALVYASGCANRSTAPTPSTEDVASYRRPDLFGSFNPDAPDVSLVNAYLLELACFVGDKGSFEVDKTLSSWGFTRRRDFRDIQAGTYGFVASDERMILVTFGGTDFLNLRDVLSDVDALEPVHDERYCPTPEARVHRGFRDSLNPVIDGVMEEVRRQARAPARTTGRAAGSASAAVTGESATTAPSTATGASSTTAPTARATDRAAARRTSRDSRGATPPREPSQGEASPGEASEGATPPRRKLFVAGHSRGGAFAVLAAAAFARSRARSGDMPELAGVYTFGQPRVGNAAFVREQERARVPLVRVVNRDDPVPNIPPPSPRAGLMGGYEHFGTVVHLRADGRVARESEAGLASRYRDVRAAAAAVDNHYQPAYQRALFAALSDPGLVEEPAWRAALPAGVAGALPKPAQ